MSMACWLLCKRVESGVPAPPDGGGSNEKSYDQIPHSGVCAWDLQFPSGGTATVAKLRPRWAPCSSRCATRSWVGPFHQVRSWLLRPHGATQNFVSAPGADFKPLVSPCGSRPSAITSAHTTREPPTCGALAPAVAWAAGVDPSRVCGG